MTRLRVVVEATPQGDRCKGCRFLATTEPRRYRPGAMRVKPWCLAFRRRLAETPPREGGEGNYNPRRVIRHDICRAAEVRP